MGSLKCDLSHITVHTVNNHTHTLQGHSNARRQPSGNRYLLSCTRARTDKKKKKSIKRTRSQGNVDGYTQKFCALFTSTCSDSGRRKCPAATIWFNATNEHISVGTSSRLMINTTNNINTTKNSVQSVHCGLGRCLFRFLCCSATVSKHLFKTTSTERVFLQ